MGVVLRQAAFSPNIKDRLDFSCALFDEHGELFAQAAHIPVHLGSMAYAMVDIVGNVEWQEKDVLVLNDPFMGGTHLPDVTLVSPLFIDGNLIAFAANRAHHANIGASTPGSMPTSRNLEEEGLLIPPTFLVKNGVVVEESMQVLQGIDGVNVDGDFSAQLSSVTTGLDRLSVLIDKVGLGWFQTGVREINQYGERLAKNTLASIPQGRYEYVDVLDDDGFEERDVRIQVAIEVDEQGITVDFSGTAAQVDGNVNCPLPVAAAAVFYVFRCLLPAQTPACAGTFKCITINAPKGCLVNAERPAAVAAGNVETSMRIVDVVLGALRSALPDRIPAASQGTMNNIAMGSRDRSSGAWDYYETIGGGMGGHRNGAGISAVQSHMTNTLNTPIESLEMHYPLRITRYEIRKGSGGKGRNPGGDGLIREFEFLLPTEVSLLSERRTHAPWGINGGEPGATGRNELDGQLVPGKCQLSIKPGQRLTILTPGGGGWGRQRQN